MSIAQRSTVSPSKLYAILDSEFKRVRPKLCKTCKMPLPYRIGRANPEASNWLIGAPDRCEHGCHAIIAELAVRLMADYDLEGPAFNMRDDNGRRLH